MVEATDVVEVPRPLEDLSGLELERKRQIGRISTATLRYLTGTLTDEGFDWLLPVVLSKSTDPLWPDPGASIEKRVETEIYGETVRTTLSMIIHKLVACSTAYPRFFVLSPNVRVEKRERKATGWHAYEFTQLDFEIRDAGFKDIRCLVEDLIVGLVDHLKKRTRDELSSLGRDGGLDAPEKPFEAYDRQALLAKYGEEWETRLPQDIREPVWVTNIPREFYDFEDSVLQRWDNYDLFVPKYGEILSGARREWEYAKISSKMERDGVMRGNYTLLLKLAREGRLKPSAGAGIGVERLVAWITGAKHIGEVQPFPKVPGMVYEL
ncbi:MAG: asparagine synthetase [Nitrososphaerota archaeon]|nr:asparagine synthetase [Nitrososphaerota archaeon]